ncbi:hypothetical protein [Occultella kanbiaonis]|uniref:hypothetical protein n=1 Tax=Occultella kanbiaonis TaxID=2675754 RepID=UPI0013D8DB9C|nr:hypothetical protein [Occultella kanbiaonis]
MPEIESWTEAAAHRQAIVNELPIPDRRRQTPAREPIPVSARIRWERDGQEVIQTEATAWTTISVLVTISDRRWPTRGVWLPAHDVTRR